MIGNCRYLTTTFRKPDTLIKKGPGLTEDTLFLKVKFDDLKAFETLVRAANEDAAFQKEALQ